MRSSLRDSTVLFVSGRTGHTLSRVERSWIPVMKALLAEGADVYLIAAHHGPLVEPARNLGVTITNYRIDRLNLWVTRNRLRASLKRFEPPVAISTGYHADIPLRLASRGLPVKVVGTYRCGGWPLVSGGPLTTGGRRKVDRRTREQVDAFVVDTIALRDSLVADGVPADRLHVVRPGIDAGRVAREAAGAAAVEGVGPGTPEGFRVGYAGALERSRGLGTLVTAAASIRERHPGTRVLVAGEGPARLGLLPAAHEGRIELVGRVSSVPAFLSSLDVCVFPASEAGIPTSLLEAAALGRPIVASDVPGIRETLADGREIVLVPRGNAAELADAVSALLADPARARALGEAARHRVLDDHPESGVAVRWLELLRGLVR